MIHVQPVLTSGQQLVAAYFIVALLIVLPKWAARKLSARVRRASVSSLIAMMFFCSVGRDVSPTSPDMRWLHSDMKDVAFWYNYKLYEKFIEVGGLK